MKFAFPVLLLASVSAIPLDKRVNLDTSPHCGQWDSVSAGRYTLFLNQWGVNPASSGSSCASITSSNGATISWKTNWSRDGGGIKAYTNMQLNDGLNIQLRDIRSISAKWHWSLSAHGSVAADVAYDFFTSTTPDGPNADEIMVWLANFNTGPISAVYLPNGNAQPIASDILLAGHRWNLYFGSNGVNNVYSFLPSNGARITTFHGDLNDFFKYLTNNHLVSSSQFLKTAQGGTEVVSGSATLTTSEYHLVIN